MFDGSVLQCSSSESPRDDVVPRRNERISIAMPRYLLAAQSQVSSPLRLTSPLISRWAPQAGLYGWAQDPEQSHK
jgi:hypothetical protein